MKKSFELFELIKSLNKAEKKYFKSFANQFRDSTESNYVQLFDLIEAQEVYNEAEIKAKLTNRKFAKNLPFSKNYLYNLLLKCLRNYHSEKSIRIQIREAYINASILFDRRLNNQALRILTKAEKLATAYQLHHELLAINLFQRILTRSFPTKGTMEKMKALQSKFTNALDQIQREHLLQSHYEELYVISQPRHAPIEKLDEIFKQYQNSIDQLIPQEPASFNELSIRCWTNSVYFRRKKQFEKSIHHQEILITFFKDHPNFLKEYQLRYFGIINNYLGLLISNYKGTETGKKVQQVIQEFENIVPNNSQLRIHKYDILYYLKIIYYLRTRQYENAKLLAPEVWNFLKRYHHHLSQTRRITVYYNFSFALFMAREYMKSLDWLEFLLENYDPKVLPDATFFARRLQILNHFELNNDILVEHLMRSMLRKYQKHKYKPPLQMTLKTIKKIFRQPSSQKDLLIAHYQETDQRPLLWEIKEWIGQKYNIQENSM
ncbi:MAG: hypothetical protein DWQ02_00505 [Bacteroidetes bacterium]|nr:MAG: hypothetical protein DWQ02_00505 [Bacteroidota bacterium]